MHPRNIDIKWHKDLIIKSVPVKESRRLGELVEITEVDTFVNDNPVDNESDNEDNEDNENRTNIELKKSEILSRQHSTNSKSVIRLKLVSFIILLVHVVFAIINFVIFSNFLSNSDNFIDVINYLSTQLNNTVSSVDTLANIIILNDPNYIGTNDQIRTISFYNNILQNNAKDIYLIYYNINNIPLISNQNLSNMIDINVNFQYVESQTVNNNVSLNYYEGLLEVL